MPSMTGGTADCARCEAAQVERGEMPAWFRSFMVCGTCGNKRCPRATWHENLCTGSNEPGQPGSAYANTPQPTTPPTWQAQRSPQKDPANEAL
jgi:hypothetical protein